jgi:hypothetical protein
MGRDMRTAGWLCSAVFFVGTYRVGCSCTPNDDDTEQSHMLLSDAGSDAGFDAGLDGPFDSGSGGGDDAGFDAGLVDMSTDGGDAGAEVDAGRDAGIVDAGSQSDSGTTVVMDAGVDAGSGGRMDAGVDAGTDAGFDAGTPDASCGPFLPVHAVPGTTQNMVMVNGSTYAQALTTNAGDLLVAIAYGGQGPSPAGGTAELSTAPNMAYVVSDTSGNAWSSGALYENATAHHEAVQIFFAPNIVGGSDTVKVVMDGGPAINPWVGFFIQEYSGVAATDVVDVSTGRTAPSTGLKPSAGAVTLSRCAVVVGAFTDGTVSAAAITAQAGWTLRSTDQWDPGGAVDNAPTGGLAGAMVNAGTSLTDDGKWVMAQIAFRGANTLAPPRPNTLAFASAPQTVTVGACSATVTLETELASTATSTPMGVDAVPSGTGLTFFADPACAYPIGVLHIGAGTQSQSFYFVAGSPGNLMLSASSTGLVSAAQVVVAN